MIRAQHHKGYEMFFNWYAPWLIKRNFYEHRIFNNYSALDRPVLVLSNHFSWWDGFILYVLNRKVFNKKFHVMMLENQLEKRMFINKIGAFSIHKGKKSMVESFQYSIRLLENAQNMVLLFPQGEIQSSYTYPFRFEKGWYRIIQQSKTPLQLVFVANLVDYYSQKKPILFSYIKDFSESESQNYLEIEHLYNTFFKECINNQKE